MSWVVTAPAAKLVQHHGTGLFPELEHTGFLNLCEGQSSTDIDLSTIACLPSLPNYFFSLLLKLPWRWHSACRLFRFPPAIFQKWFEVPTYNMIPLTLIIICHKWLSHISNIIRRILPPTLSTLYVNSSVIRYWPSPCLHPTTSGELTPHRMTPTIGLTLLHGCGPNFVVCTCYLRKNH